MLIEKIQIRNYKSLPFIEWKPNPFNIIVGANGAGKSNLPDAFDFLAQVYAQGLEIAVRNRGGYENLVFRNSSPAKKSIEFECEIFLSLQEMDR